MNNLGLISTWVPSLTVSGLLALALWLSRSLIEARLRASVQNEFDSKLETLKGEIRASEEHLRARLREREAELEALRSGALSAMASRQVALDHRRLEAIDQLWSAYTELNRARYIASLMAVRETSGTDLFPRPSHDPRNLVGTRMRHHPFGRASTRQSSAEGGCHRLRK